MSKLFLCSALVAAVGCGPSIAVDPGEGSGDTPAVGPIAEFDPANSILPFPNNLALDATTKKVNLPAQPCESPASKAVREGVLNTLDGFGAYEATLTATFTATPDPTTAATSVKVYALGAVGSAATEVPAVILPGMAVRFKDANSCATPTLVPELVIVPMVPLAQKTTYALAVLDTLTTTDGTPFLPSATWVLTRSKAEPATFDDAGNVTSNHTPLDPIKDAATLKALDGLWQVHALALDEIAVAGHTREHVIVASTFTVATVTDTIDPAVAGSVGADDGLAGFVSMTAFRDSVQFASDQIHNQGQGGNALKALLGQQTCDAIGCDNVGDLLGALVNTTQYQTKLPNPGGAGLPAVPGPFNDPVHPTEPGDPFDAQVPAFIMTPHFADMPATGWPVVIFGHGLGSKKESLAVFGPQLAGKGFASVAIDFVESGSRAVRTSNTGACADQGGTPPDPTTDAGRACYGSILSTDLAQTRDNIRQTVLDLRRVLAALKRCANGCAGPDGLTFKVDTSKIFYTGISLGGIIGSTFVSLSPEVHAAVLNVPGVGLIDILENTQSAAIRCSLVDGLIAAGILQGQPSSAGAGALCIAQDQGWKTQPGYLQFAAIARWVLDPADGGNYVSRLASRKILVQEVVDDQVVPNIATDREAGVIGFTAPSGNADPMLPTTTTPSAAVAAGSHQWVRYPNLPADAGTGFPGNTFQHASLLQPVADGAAGQLGTARVQLDAIAFLLLNGQ